MMQVIKLVVQKEGMNDGKKSLDHIKGAGSRTE